MKIEDRLRRAIELQKKFGKRLFCSDNAQWDYNDDYVDISERDDAFIATLFAELESSAEGLPESAFCLVAKQLSDCRKTLEFKFEQIHTHQYNEDTHQYDWDMNITPGIEPLMPYMSPKRFVECGFENLFSVEHLASLFRFCIDLMDDCRHVFEDADIELIHDVLKYQFEKTKKALEEEGYFFVDSNSCNDDVQDPTHAIMLKVMYLI